MDQAENLNAEAEVFLFTKSDAEQFGCPTTAIPLDASVTMAYIPYQLDKTAYSPEEGLAAGSFFKVLNKPFTGRSNVR